MKLQAMGIVAFACTLVGCVPAEPLLRWNAMPAMNPGEGSVTIGAVINKRPVKKGADDLNRLGNARSGFGIPYVVSSMDAGYGVPTPVDFTLRRLVEESLLAAGLQTRAPGPPSATVIVEVLELWTDGYANYKANVSIDLVILDPTNQGFRARIPLRREGNGGNWVIAFQQALEGVHADAIQSFRDPRVRASLVAGMNAAPPPPPMGGGPAAGGGCTKDTDCKGDRVCDRGQCVTPR